MKVPVRSAPQLQDLRIIGRESFFVEHQHPAFHVFNVAMSGSIVVAVINKRFGNKADLEQSSNAITKIQSSPTFMRVSNPPTFERFASYCNCLGITTETDFRIRAFASLYLTFGLQR